MSALRKMYSNSSTVMNIGQPMSIRTSKLESEPVIESATENEDDFYFKVSVGRKLYYHIFTFTKFYYTLNISKTPTQESHREIHKPKTTLKPPKYPI